MIMLAEVRKMTPLETGKITDRIYVIKDLYVNMYVIACDSGLILVDAGNNPDTINNEFHKLALEVKNVVAVFLTHSDDDHVASLPLFPNAKIYLSRQEEPMIKGEQTRFLFFRNKLDSDRYLLIEDGQTINITGCTVESILTPGHTPGSTCYLLQHQYLFT